MSTVALEEVGLSHNGQIEVIPLPHALGAEVRCGDVKAIDDATAAVVHRALLDNLVILIRDQELTDEDQLDFARHFGVLRPGSKPEESPKGMKARTNPYIGINSNIKENGVPIGQFGDKEVVWHTDHSYREIPLSYSVLYGTLAPERGGETGFCNMYLALETLPEATRERIKGLSIKNDAAYNSGGQLRGNQKPPGDIRTSPGPNHPIVCTHPKTGYNALYLGRRPFAYVNGLTLEDSEALLDELWAHATKPEFQWHHKWREGDILMWDNRAVMHHRNAIPPGQDRIAKRCQLDGDPTTCDPAAFAKPPHPRGYLNVQD